MLSSGKSSIQTSSTHRYYRPNAGDTYRHFIRVRLTSPYMMNKTAKLLETADEVPALAAMFKDGKL